NRVLFGIVRQPGAGRQRRTVLQRYQGVLDNTHRLWEIRDNHGGLLMMAAVCRLAAASEENKRGSSRLRGGLMRNHTQATGEPQQELRWLAPSRHLARVGVESTPSGSRLAAVE